MKLNNKGYMLVEIVLASVIAMSIGYYLLNLTFKFKNKNDDIYNSASLVTDKIIITKNIMDDLDNKIVKITNQSSSGDKTYAFLKVNGVNKKIEIDKTQKTITYGNIDSQKEFITNDKSYYKKELPSHIEIVSTKIESDRITISIKSIYEKNATDINIFIREKAAIFTYNGTNSQQNGTDPANNNSYQEFTIGETDESETEQNETGWYKIEAWGASGGQPSTNEEPGKGGYTSGYIELSKDDKIYVYVGGEGNVTLQASSAGGYNGGGASGANGGASSGGGGGATDIRLVNGEWNNADSLNSRIMVAAGGGGSGNYSTATNGYKIPGGNGGGLVGANGTSTNSYYSKDNFKTTGATQRGGGINTYRTNEKKITSSNGSFGYANQISPDNGYGGGAGAGYYGGAQGYGTGGSGGSSFISGYAGVNAITSASSRTPTNNTRHYSTKYFINGKMQSGVNSGNGKVKISYYGVSKPPRTNDKLNNVRYIKDCTSSNTKNPYNHWVELQAIKDGLNIAKGKTATGITNKTAAPISRITDGDITSAYYAEGTTNTGTQCITIDLGNTYDVDEIAVWHYWDDGRTYYNNTTSVSTDRTTWKTVIDTNEPETSLGKRVSAYE